MKVNEFEHGTDREIYHTHRNMQQAYGPEANFHYRANSADEILGDLNKLRNMILDHHQVECPHLASLDNYMKARNDGIYNTMMSAGERKERNPITGQPTTLLRSSISLTWDTILGSRSRKQAITTASMNWSGNMTGRMI